MNGILYRSRDWEVYRVDLLWNPYSTKYVVRHRCFDLAYKTGRDYPPDILIPNLIRNP